MQEIFSKTYLNAREISTIVDSDWPQDRKERFLCSNLQEYLVSLKVGLEHVHGLAMHIVSRDPKSILFYKDRKPEDWIRIASEGFTAIKDISIPVLGAEYFKK
jgi:hypothetical protein